MSARKEKQPLDFPSAGSTFKRCEGHYTAKMIDEAGLKGYSVGGAQVSEKHAGFIINKDKISDFDSVSDILENTLIQTKHYVDSSVSKMIDSIEKFIATTPTNDEIEANDKIIAKNSSR